MELVLASLELANTFLYRISNLNLLLKYLGFPARTVFAKHMRAQCSSAASNIGHNAAN